MVSIHNKYTERSKVKKIETHKQEIQKQYSYSRGLVKRETSINVQVCQTARKKSTALVCFLWPSINNQTRNTLSSSVHSRANVLLNHANCALSKRIQSHINTTVDQLQDFASTIHPLSYLHGRLTTSHCGNCSSQNVQLTSKEVDICRICSKKA